MAQTAWRCIQHFMPVEVPRMADIVLGVGSSHTPMLNAQPGDWPRFIDLDRLRPHQDLTGLPVTYAELLGLQQARVAAEMEPALMQARYDMALGHVAHLGRCLLQARLDALVIVGDDQKELFQTHNMPSVLVYHGATIRNVPLRSRPGPEWARAASARYYEPHTPRDYPVHAELALHIVDRLIDAEFDLAVADTLPEGQGEGHAFGFVHCRLLEGEALPVVPIFLNTYYPPNQPTPRRCHRLGQALRTAIRAFPADMRVGVLASGGLSHFTVNETLDAEVMRALRENDSQALSALPKELLNAGNSEIRNWICMAGAVDHLPLQSMDYVPGYRTPAGTGTGLCFAVWQ
jgi:3-O-methylgallate 3,4-dioxygenase